MRIIAGKFKNQAIAAPKGIDVRPTGSRVREAIFNILYSRLDISECILADVCCGTGAVGLEALSRGAKFCTFIDADTKSVSYNVKQFGLEEDFLIVRSPAQKVRLNQLADVVFLDPPYYQDIAENVMKNFANIGKKDALWFVEVEKQRELEVNENNFEILEQRRYGISKIYILKQLV